MDKAEQINKLERIKESVSHEPLKRSLEDKIKTLKEGNTVNK